ncbi:MAG TPA: phosphatase PAP2 family protein, partial [Pyrinomonadaceae bacterium]|nr:phosphatase PAP2 family protein [Pyrinomonadaceae bacterium]
MTRTPKLKTLAAAAISAALLLLFLWFASEVYEGETLAFDISVREWVHGFASEKVTKFLLAATYLGSAGAVVGASLAAAIWFLWNKDRRAAAAIATIVVGELILNNVLKFSYARTRPEAYFNYPLPSSYSFPSGHSFGAFCLYLSFAYLLTRKIRSTAAVVTVWTVAVFVVLLIGLSRVYLGVH